jgi:hypothetical protein
MMALHTGIYEYDVWGGYEGQEDGDHWATFSTLAEAEAYRGEQLQENSQGGAQCRLFLHISQREKRS